MCIVNIFYGRFYMLTHNRTEIILRLSTQIGLDLKYIGRTCNVRVCTSYGIAISKVVSVNLWLYISSSESFSGFNHVEKISVVNRMIFVF